MLRALAPILACSSILVLACSDESPTPDGGAGRASSAGKGGTGGNAGTAPGGTAGQSSGAGTAGSTPAGASGTTAVGGAGGASSGASGSSAAGTSGAANPGGTGGVGGGAGVAGSAGSAGGALGGAGAGGSAGTTAGSAGSGAGTGGSGSAVVSDDFEGEMIDSAKWTLDIKQNGTIALSTEQKKSGSKSVKVVGSGGVTMLVNTSVFPLPNGVIHLRAWMYFTTASWQNHTAFVAASPGAESQEVRFGGQANAYHANLAADGDGLSPNPFQSPSCDLCVAPVANTWACIRGMFDFTNDDITLYVGDELAVDARDASDWHSGSGNLPTAPTQIGFGWTLYGGVANTVYYDDIALGYEPIPCE